RQGRSVVVDDTFSHRFLRDRCRRVAGACGARFTILFLDTPLAEIQSRRQRNRLQRTREELREDVFAHHLARFEYPAADEEVVRIGCDGDLAAWIAAAARVNPAALPAATDYEQIASRYAAAIDARPWNALYERP